VKDSEKFGARIAEIGVVVEKIRRKEFQRPIYNFWKVARAIYGNTFRFQGSIWNFVDYDLICCKYKGFFAKLAGIFDWDLFLNGKM
jgi:hypothetical protein